MYEEFSTARDFYQGDILNDIPQISSGDPKKTFTVMILSQSCDIDHRESILVAPVVKVDDLIRAKIAAAAQVASQIIELEKRRILYWFYLPANGNLEKSYVDFTKITNIPPSLLQKDLRVKALSDLGRHWLSYELGEFFGRPVGTE